MSSKDAWCLRFNEESDNKWNFTEDNLERTDNIGVIQCHQGKASIIGRFVPYLSKSIKRIQIFKKGQLWLEFSQGGEQKTEYKVY